MEKSLLEKFLSRKGQIVSLSYARPLKTRKKYASLKIVKIGKLVCRAGVSYNNIQAVKDKREQGELPLENPGLPYGSWEVYPHIIKHQGLRQFRFTTLPDAKRFNKVAYFLNGKHVSEQEIRPYVLSSELEKKELDVFNMKEENILDIK